MKNAQALMFDGPVGPVTGWWHAGATQAQRALVLCSPWGDEDLGAYRGLHELAVSLASAGWPVLRFDWPGQGDAFDGELAGGIDALPVWLAALDRAIDLARQLAGVNEVVLVGLRLGGLLAAQVAARRGLQVAGLGLILPPASGRAWLREGMMLGARVSALAAHADSAAPVQMLGGFPLAPASVAALKALAWPARPAVQPVWVMERSDLPLAASALKALGQGGAMTHRARDDLGSLVAIAHQAHWPAGIAGNLLAWLDGLDAPVATGGPPLPTPCPPAVGQAEGVREAVLTLPLSVPCVGVLSRPAATPRPAAARGLLLLSSGAERRTGPHRLWVAFARERARRGDVVLRVDLPGIGDSPSREAGRPDDVYDPRVVQDLAAALDWMRQQQGVDEIAIMGLCSGGFHAWRAAVQGLPADLAVVLNPLVYHWQPGMSLDPMAHDFGAISVAADVGRALRDPARWQRLLRGQANLPVIARALWTRAWGRGLQALRGLARACRWPLRNDLPSDLRRVQQGKTQLHFVFAEQEPGLVLLREQAGSALPRAMRGGRVGLHTIASADHTFAGLVGRSQLYQHLHHVLDAHVATARGH